MRVVAAGDAVEFLLCGPVLLRHVPACGAGAGGVAGVHGDHVPSGAFSLGVQDRQEHPPSGIADRPVEPGLDGGPVGQEAARPAGIGLGRGGLAHVADPEVFVRDEVMRADQAEGGLVCVVETLAAHLAVEPGDLLHRAPVVGGAVLGLAAREPGQGPLRGLKLLGCPAAVARECLGRGMPWQPWHCLGSTCLGLGIALAGTPY